MKAIQSIKAIQYRAYGAYAENRFVDLPAPAANDGQVLVRMHTVGINPRRNPNAPHARTTLVSVGPQSTPPALSICDRGRIPAG